MLYSEKLKPVPFKVSAATQSEYQRQFKDWCLLGPISPEPKVFQDAPEFQRKVGCLALHYFYQFVEKKMVCLR